jgi:hypothetical protein
MTLAEPSATAPLPRKTPWYASAAAKYLMFVLLLQGLLLGATYFRGFELDQRKGLAVLITFTVTAILLLVMVGWLIVGRFFKSKPQFSLATLMLVVVVAAIPSAWMAHEYRESQRQDVLVVEGSRKGYVMAGDSKGRSGLTLLPPSIQDFLTSTLGPGFFSDVTKIDVFKLADDRDIELITQFPRLKNATFFRARFTDAGMARLGKHTSLKELIVNQEAVDLGAPRLTDAAFEGLAGLTDLRMLYLNNAGLTDAGVEKLAGLSKLEDISITYADVTDKGLELLQSLPHLRVLTLQNTKVTREGIARFKAAAINCVVME